MFIPENFKDKKALIIGAGKSGIACGELLINKGFKVLISEKADSAKLRAALKNLPAAAEIELGGHSERVLSCGFAVKCPGVKQTSPLILKLKSNKIPVFSEVEIALAFAKTPYLLAISGTNGKTTTTLLLGAIMARHALGKEFKSIIAGNIGSPLSSFLPCLPQGSFISAELSSYQLEDSTWIKPKVAALLNITPDHFAHHGGFEQYIAAKMRIFMFQDKTDFCILNYDNPICKSLADKVKSKILWFSSSAKGGLLNGYIERGSLAFAFEGKQIFINPPKLLGKHNMENALAAGLMALAAGAELSELQIAFENFKPIEHRIEPAGIINGVKFINDSKATNIDSAIIALRTMPAEKKVWLILGGRDKGAAYLPLSALIKEKVKGIFLVGEAAEKIAGELGGICELKNAGTIKEACRLILKCATSGDIALLSPACSSLDQFENYEERGMKFKAYVAELSNAEK